MKLLMCMAVCTYVRTCVNKAVLLVIGVNSLKSVTQISCPRYLSLAP